MTVATYTALSIIFTILGIVLWITVFVLIMNRRKMAQMAMMGIKISIAKDWENHYVVDGKKVADDVIYYLTTDKKVFQDWKQAYKHQIQLLSNEKNEVKIKKIDSKSDHDPKE